MDSGLETGEADLTYRNAAGLFSNLKGKGGDLLKWSMNGGSPEGRAKPRVGASHLRWQRLFSTLGEKKQGMSYLSLDLWGRKYVGMEITKNIADLLSSFRSFSEE